MTKFQQIILLFAATLSGVFADVETPGDESGKH